MDRLLITQNNKLIVKDNEEDIWVFKDNKQWISIDKDDKNELISKLTSEITNEELYKLIKLKKFVYDPKNMFKYKGVLKILINKYYWYFDKESKDLINTKSIKEFGFIRYHKFRLYYPVIKYINGDIEPLKDIASKVFNQSYEEYYAGGEYIYGKPFLEVFKSYCNNLEEYNCQLYIQQFMDIYKETEDYFNKNT